MDNPSGSIRVGLVLIVIIGATSHQSHSPNYNGLNVFQATNAHFKIKWAIKPQSGIDNSTAVGNKWNCCVTHSISYPGTSLSFIVNTFTITLYINMSRQYWYLVINGLFTIIMFAISAIAEAYFQMLQPMNTFFFIHLSTYDLWPMTSTYHIKLSSNSSPIDVNTHFENITDNPFTSSNRYKCQGRYILFFCASSIFFIPYHTNHEQTKYVLEQGMVH